MMEKTKKKSKVRRYLPFYLMALPGLVYLFINNYMPMGGLILAFKNYSARKGIWGSNWAGLKNFKFLFATQDAWTITRNTLCYNIAFIILGTILSVTIAILLSEVKAKAAKFYQSFILLPHLISWVIISYLVFAFLSAESGFINNTILAALGKEGINWYSEAKYWPVIIVLVYLWQSTGYTSIVYYASVVGFDKGYYEAAELEGAGPWQKIRYITLPLLRPVIITMVMLSVGRIFYSDFGLFYQLSQGASGSIFKTTATIDTYIYNALRSSTIGMTSAAAFFQSVACCITIILANAIVKKFDEDSAII